MISSAIKKRAEASGLTINKLEKKAGLKAGSIYNILSGRSKNPSFFIIQSIANALDCSVSEFIENSDDQDVSLKKMHSQEHQLEIDGNLYHATVTYLLNILKSKKISLTREKFIYLTEEVYCYSAKIGTSEVDKNFVNWILDKYLSESR
ncbi:MAG: helix-turn-helix transcriptional regulator [Rickettsiaceae bacterium]|nr:helix-turn-helix transcriptional regulator [Rickettsiaceae bacterium]